VANEIQSEQVEIIQEFVQETRDMVEQLEPIIIELGQHCKPVDCWYVSGCNNTECPRYEKKVALPCWLHLGYIDTGAGTCTVGESKQDCLKCEVFQATNGDNQTINAIFRLFHSMKGSAGFLELEHITKVAHSAENLLDLIRSGSVLIETGHVTILCEGCDFTKDALEYLEEHFTDSGMADAAAIIDEKLINAISDAKALVDQYRSELGMGAKEEAAEPKQAKAKTSKAAEVVEEGEEAFPISPELQERFINESDEHLQDFEQGILKWMDSIDDMEIVGHLFRHIHSFKGDCGFLGFSDLENLSHQVETILDAVKQGANLDRHKSAKVLLELVDVIKIALINISEEGSGSISNVNIYIELLETLLPKGWLEPQEKREEPPPLGDLLIEDGVVTHEQVEGVLKEQNRRFGEILLDKGEVTPSQIDKALLKQKEARAKAPKPKPREAIKAAPIIKRQDIRVDLTKLDNLINIIGELVIAENVVVNNPDLDGMVLENFHKASQQMNKLIRELQEMAMVIRMIPVVGLFRRMIRLVHDLSVKSGKKVDLKLIGEDTELDKTVIETITDPLIHLIRNSMDHGVEMPEERKKAGKTGTGTIKLTATHEEGEVWITIDDDGKGLDRDKIIEKALSKGMIEDASEMSNQEVFSLIFQPGFSTADKITDVSGRGVGMDVVLQNLKKINGKVEVNSKKGKGTRIRLKIPLTLAIIEGMVVRVADTKCILPILSIRENFKPSPDLITVSPDGSEIVRIREKFFSILRLHNVLGKEPDFNDFHDGILILIESHGNSICLFVDEILGQQQTVIKGLSKYIGNIKGVSGCTILGTGEVSLILDAGSLVEMVEQHKG
jgi:two-component system chemotaxis sensor kinase CheA